MKSQAYMMYQVIITATDLFLEALLCGEPPARLSPHKIASVTTNSLMHHVQLHTSLWNFVDQFYCFRAIIVCFASVVIGYNTVDKAFLMVQWSRIV